MPRVHRVMSLLKRWLLATHQGAVSHKHLDYYLDEFTFRFNRRKSKSRGKLLSARPAGGSRGSRDLQDDCSPGYRTQENLQTTRYWGYLSQPYTHLQVLAFAVGAEAQVTTATIYGRVEDPSGAIGGSYSRGVD